MDTNDRDRHIAALRLTLQQLVDEAENRVLNLEVELVQAKEVVRRMRAALADSQKPF